jgi:hypothetical protein
LSAFHRTNFEESIDGTKVVTRFPISRLGSFLAGTLSGTGFVLDLTGDLVEGNSGVVLGVDTVRSNFIATFWPR